MGRSRGTMPKLDIAVDAYIDLHSRSVWSQWAPTLPNFPPALFLDSAHISRNMDFHKCLKIQISLNQTPKSGFWKHSYTLNSRRMGHLDTNNHNYATVLTCAPLLVRRAIFYPSISTEKISKDTSYLYLRILNKSQSNEWLSDSIWLPTGQEHDFSEHVSQVQNKSFNHFRNGLSSPDTGHSNNWLLSCMVTEQNFQTLTWGPSWLLFSLSTAPWRDGK